MLICNTTFNIETSTVEEFTGKIEQEIIPRLIQTELFSKAIFAEVFTDGYSEGKTYSLQLFCPSKAHLSQFKKMYNHHITDLVQVYKGKLVYFQTSMAVMSVKNL